MNAAGALGRGCRGNHDVVGRVPVALRGCDAPTGGLDHLDQPPGVSRAFERTFDIGSHRWVELSTALGAYPHQEIIWSKCQCSHLASGQT